MLVDGARLESSLEPAQQCGVVVMCEVLADCADVQVRSPPGVCVLDGGGARAAVWKAPGVPGGDRLEHEHFSLDELTAHKRDPLAFAVGLLTPFAGAVQRDVRFARPDRARPSPSRTDKQADILLSGITTIDNPAARNWHLDVTSTNPMGVTNQEFINRGLNHQPGPEEHDPRNDVLISAKRAEKRKHTKYDAICAATGSVLPPFALETTGGHGASAASVYFLLKKQIARLGSAGGRAAWQA